jgi:hypothetical protein
MQNKPCRNGKTGGSGMKGPREKGGPGTVYRYSHAIQLAVAVTGITLALGHSPVHAAQPASDSSADEPDTIQSTPPDRAADSQRRQKPAPTFTPSEQVGADSAVSFPVDI